MVIALMTIHLLSSLWQISLKCSSNWYPSYPRKGKTFHTIFFPQSWSWLNKWTSSFIPSSRRVNIKYLLLLESDLEGAGKNSCEVARYVTLIGWLLVSHERPEDVNYTHLTTSSHTHTHTRLPLRCNQRAQLIKRTI